MAAVTGSERRLLHGACADPYHDFSHPPKSVGGNLFNTNQSYHLLTLSLSDILSLYVLQ